MEGSMLVASQLYNVLGCFGADKDEKGKFIVRGNITSFLGAGDEFVIDATAEYRRQGQWCNLLQAVKVTSYHMPIEVY
jgi:hypothetical protein